MILGGVYRAKHNQQIFKSQKSLTVAFRVLGLTGGESYRSAYYLASLSAYHTLVKIMRGAAAALGAFKLVELREVPELAAVPAAINIKVMLIIFVVK